MKWQVTEQGPRAVIEVWRENDGEGLYKAHLVGAEQRCLLGTLMPENGRLYLRRTLSIDELKRRGVWPVRCVEEEMVCSFRERPPTIVWEDEVLRQCAKNLPRHTVRREGEGFVLSFPFDPYTRFPLPPAFCFARLEGGRIVFSLQKNGTPYIPAQEGKNRGEVNTKEGTPWQT